jgi:hypothetical protein
MPQEQNQQMQIKITDEILKGVYANAMQVLHTQDEFVMDFMDIFPPNGIVNARVIVSPANMKRIIEALQENLKKYEEQFSEIKKTTNPANPTTTSSSDHQYGFDTSQAK